MSSATTFDVVGVGLTVIAVLMLIPTGLLLLQVVMALLPARGDPGPASLSLRRPRVAVLVPAHNEEVGIARTLRSIQAQLDPNDRLLVVADNCSDHTARIAAAAGAEVVERVDAARRGKGYALDFGVRHLEADPPDVVVVIDADCQLHPGSLDALARLCVHERRPVQALNLMRAPADATPKTRIAEFAWLVKNQVRPLGYRRLGLPCQLMGTGMAFPWDIIRAAPLASGHIAEDLRLGLDLAAVSMPPLFCPSALVTSLFATHPQGARDQRVRWERGHVGVMLQEAPRAFWNAVTRVRPALAAMAIDVCVPPLTILVLLLGAQAVLDAIISTVGGARTPLWLALAALTMLAVAIGAAWGRFGRDVIGFRELLGVPLYVLVKLPLYARFLRHGKGEWVRTRRDGSHE